MGDGILAPWHIIILVVVLVLLFGSRRLPGAAKSLGESMHIFKRSVQGLNPEEKDDFAGWPLSNTMREAPPTGLQPPPDATQQQLADLQRQVAELQRQSAGSNGGQSSETQTPQSL